MLFRSAGKPENSQTVRQWALRGRVPKEGAKPSYIWLDGNRNPRSIYYLEEDTREMTPEEDAAFKESERIKDEQRKEHMRKMREKKKCKSVQKTL